MTRLAEKLNYLKGRYHFTTKEFADRAQVPVGTLNKILNGTTKRPALATMEKIAGVFHVPIHYFADDAIPNEYQLGVLTEYHQLETISDREWRLIAGFRRLRQRDQQRLEAMLGSFQAIYAGREEVQGTIMLYCYQAPVRGVHGMCSEGLEVRRIEVEADAVAQEADLAVQVEGRGLEPLYQSGVVLGVKREQACHGDLGIFAYRGECFLRKLYKHRGICRLETINGKVPNLLVDEPEALSCIGKVVGVLTPVG